jgi:hypothetical protein
MGRVGVRIGLAVAALAFAACSKGSLMPDGVVTGAGGAGAAGTGGQGGGAGITTVSGTAGTPSCTAADVHVKCDANVQLPGGWPIGQPCSVTGAHCEGFTCNDSFSGSDWKASCCAGYWYATSDKCPDRARPGDPFVCGRSTDNLGCVAGQSYCSYANEDRTTDSSYACKPLCAAGDCTCFCDKADGCTFAPPGSTCPADTCECGEAATAPGIPIPGTVSVWCRYLASGTSVCFPAPLLDSQCGGLSRAFLCEGPARDRGAGCVQLPDSLTAVSCGSEVHYYCCGS